MNAVEAGRNSEQEKFTDRQAKLMSFSKAQPVGKWLLELWIEKDNDDLSLEDVTATWAEEWVLGHAR